MSQKDKKLNEDKKTFYIIYDRNCLRFYFSFILLAIKEKTAKPFVFISRSQVKDLIVFISLKNSKEDSVKNSR